MRAILQKGTLALSTLALTTGSASAQTFGASASNPSQVTAGIAILLIGFLGILSLGTYALNSPVALLGEAGSVVTFLLAILGIVNVRLFWIVGTIHMLSLAATGVFINE